MLALGMDTCVRLSRISCVGRALQVTGPLTKGYYRIS
jgi:hypothetical protein